MKNLNKLIFSILLFAGVTLGVVPGLQAQDADAAEQTIFVQSGSYTEDLHRAFMAIKLAHGLQEKGANVILFLNLESARAADKTVPNDIVWGSGEPYSYYYEGFVKAGGKILVCPHCAKAAGVTPDQLRDGAKIAEFGEVTDAILAADKILDY